MSTVAGSVAEASEEGGSVSTRRPVLTWLEFLAAALIALIWLGAIFWLAVRDGVPGDFSAFYCGGKILRAHGSGGLYDFTAMGECHSRDFPRADPVLPFIRPPFYALLAAPLGLLAPRPALLAWLCLNALALVAAVYLTAKAIGMRASATAWHAAIFFPALAAFFNRQDVPLLLLLVVAAYLLLDHGRHFAAGLTLAACAVKFHLLLLVPLAWLLKKNWRALAGLAVGAGILLLVSALMVGPGGLIDYARMLVEARVPNMESHPQRFVNLWNLAGATWIRIALAVLTVAAVAAAGLRLPQKQALSAAWMGSLLVSPHVVISDYLLAFPACLLLARLGLACFLASLLLLFPFVPLLLVLDERLVLLAPAASLVCLLGAAASPAPRWEGGK